MAARELDGAADYARQCFEESLDPEWPWYSIKVGVQEFLVAKPRVYSDNPGRAARGYVAVCYSPESARGRFVWLKDTWRRTLDDEYEQEGAVLYDLNRLGVQNVPTLVCHADVSSHRFDLKDTLERMHGRQPTRRRSRIERVHYRVVTAEVGVPIEDFGNSWQLASVFRDCLIGHRDAYARARVLHRDISQGNILMVPYDDQVDGEKVVAYRGMLIDWEFAERVFRRSVPGFGTWPYLSVNAMNHPEVPVTPEDDLESFFHSFVGLAISYIRH
ncbi:hypothetical protein L227DRAFT_506401, partial [Lentinus tigrinus ALCF2SS1-6]